MYKPAIYCFLLLFFSIQAISQTTKISGTILDASAHNPLKGAEVLLKNSKDTLKAYGVITNAAGQFSFNNVPRGNYFIKIRYLGYRQYIIKIVADRDIVNLNNINMQPATTVMKDIDINAKMIRTQQIGDTTQYNADAFKTKPDADAVDLVTKMPGITVDNGTVKSQNENIQQVTIDGKPFFGEDPSLALKSLPAEIIEKIQVFDKLSDQSQFTGFDDGNTIKTMNIITRMGKNNGQFGKLYGGYGTDDRDIAGGYVNYFQGDERISLIGMTNNINMQNFSAQDLLGIQGGNGRSGRFAMGGGRPGGGGGVFTPPGGSSNFLVDQQGGISSTNSIGLNYINNIGKKIKITGSYFFNNLDNTKNTSLTRSYFNSDSLNNETNNSSGNNYNHRFNVRFEYNIDSSNSIIMTPKMYIQLNNANNRIVGDYIRSNQIEADYFNNYKSENTGYTFDNNLLLRHKFPRKGRTISLNIGTTINDKSGDGYLTSGNTSFFPDTENTTNQKINSYSNTSTLNPNISYTEPVGKSSQLQVNYNPVFSKSSIHQKLYNDDPVNYQYDLMDTNLTNVFNSSYFNQRTGLSYRYRKDKLMFSTGVTYQYYELIDNQTFPANNNLHMYYNNILPNIIFNYKFSQTSSLRLNYRASTTIPSVSQLQNVIDNSNPNMLASGNPALRQQNIQNFFGNYSLTNVTQGKTFFIYFNASYITNYIGNSVFHAYKDTMINNAVKLYSGGQYTKLVNLDNSWNIRSFITYGIPVDLIKCNLNFHTGFQYNMIPGIVDGVNDMSETYNTSEGIVLSSNMNENLDFTVLYTANYNIVYYSLQPQNNNNYFSHTASVKLNWILYKGFFIGGDATNYLYRGLTKTYNQDFFLVDPCIGKKLFKNQAGEIKLSAYDILKQNKSITRTITDSYIEDSNTMLLQQYFLLTFTYNIKKYKQQDNKDIERHQFNDHEFRPY